MSGWRLQGLRYGVLGIVSNIVLYLLYLFFTGVGFGYKTTMTTLFITGTVQSFFFNKRWTFEYQGNNKSTFAKYFLIYGIGYLANLIGLTLFVDYLNFPHEIVQGILILVVSSILFMLQSHWVFKKNLIEVPE